MFCFVLTSAIGLADLPVVAVRDVMPRLKALSSKRAEECIGMAHSLGTRVWQTKILVTQAS